MIGDSPTHDIAAAHQLRLRTIWIRRNRAWPLETVAPNHTVNTPAEVIPLLTSALPAQSP